MRTLLTFTKTGRMRFLSHLDLIRLFRRAFRRAKVDIQYTEGFNPQQKLAVTNPLPLGYESTMEFMMIETDTPFTEEKRERLNRELPEGVLVTAAEEPSETFDLHTHFVTSVYEWRGLGEEESDRLYALLQEQLQQESLLLTRERVKKGKKRVQQKEIRPLICALRRTSEGIIETELSSFDVQTLRPGDWLAYLKQEGHSVPTHIIFRRTAQHRS